MQDRRGAPQGRTAVFSSGLSLGCPAGQFEEGGMDVLKGITFLLTILGALGAGILTVAGGADGVWKHEGVARVDCPKELVFEVLTEPDLRKAWVEGLVSSKSSSGQDLEKGATLEETYVLDGATERRSMKVVAYQVGERFAFEASTTDGGRVEFDYRLRPNMGTGKTRIDYTCTVEYSSWWATILEPILGHFELERIEAEFERLAVEAADRM